MPTFRATSSYQISGTFEDATLDHTVPTARIGVNIPKAYTSGTGANQANQWWADQRTLTATSENLDLFGGLTDDFGNTINLATIRELVILNRSTVSGESLILSGTALIGLIAGTGTNVVSLGAGGRFAFGSPIDGYTITNTTQDILTVNSQSFTITYDIFLIGTV